MNILYETTGEMKTIAKKHLDGFWGKVTLAAILFILLNDFMPLILANITPPSLIVTIEGVSASYLSSLYEMFTMPAFTFGICSFLLGFFRMKDTHPGHIFDGFGYYFKSFGLIFMIGLFTFLWTLCFIIPGIIAVFSYSQAVFILADNPEKGIIQCIRESKELMKGNKLKYFILNLSFFGWMFLIALGQSLAAQMGFNLLLIDFVFLVPSAILYGYVGTTLTVFYELLIGNLPRKKISFDSQENVMNDINMGSMAQENTEENKEENKVENNTEHRNDNNDNNDKNDDNDDNDIYHYTEIR